MAKECLSFRDQTALEVFVRLLAQDLRTWGRERNNAGNARVAYDAADALVAERQRRLTALAGKTAEAE